MKNKLFLMNFRKTFLKSLYLSKNIEMHLYTTQNLGKNNEKLCLNQYICKKIVTK